MKFRSLKIKEELRHSLEIAGRVGLTFFICMIVYLAGNLLFTFLKYPFSYNLVKFSFIVVCSMVFLVFFANYRHSEKYIMFTFISLYLVGIMLAVNNVIYVALILLFGFLNYFLLKSIKIGGLESYLHTFAIVVLFFIGVACISQLLFPYNLNLKINLYEDELLREKYSILNCISERGVVLELDHVNCFPEKNYHIKNGSIVFLLNNGSNVNKTIEGILDFIIPQNVVKIKLEIDGFEEENGKRKNDSKIYAHIKSQFMSYQEYSESRRLYVTYMGIWFLFVVLTMPKIFKEYKKYFE